MIIYKTTNLINGKIYIGKQIEDNDSYLGSGKLLKLSLKKYGRDNFKKEILQVCSSKDELNERERYWIKHYGSTDFKTGYNISDGGDGGDTFTNHPNKEEYINHKIEGAKRMWLNEEYRNHMAKVRTGLKRSDEARLKMREASLNVPKSEEHKISLSKAWERRKIEKPHTEETLQKMSKSMLGKNVGKYIKIYEFLGPDNITYTTNEGLVKFAKSKHIHPDSFRKLVKGLISEYHGWTYIKTIKE